jgi:hypothetical protein
VKRAAYRGERITFGPNHGDDVTLIATERVRRIEARVRELEREVATLRADVKRPRPFAALQAEIDDGALLADPVPPRRRRRMADVAPEAPLTREERVRLGAQDDRTPEFRRTRPRA